MGSKTRLNSYCTKRGDNTMNLATSRKKKTRDLRALLPLRNVIIDLLIYKANCDRPTLHLQRVIAGL